MMRRPIAPIETSPGDGGDGEVRASFSALRASPILILGGSRWSQEASDRRRALCGEASRCRSARPFAVCISSTPLHPCYAGDLGIGPNPKLVDRIKSADLVVLIGGRMGELPSQSYTLFDIPRPQMAFVHVHPGAEELGRVYSAHCRSTPRRRRLPRRSIVSKLPSARRAVDAEAAAHADYLPGRRHRPSSRARSISARSWCGCANIFPATPSSATAPATTPRGFIASFASAAFGQHIAPTSGSMGYGVPAAVAMKRLYPERPVICVAGDGDFLMNGQEFATAVQYDLPFIVAHRRQRHLRHHPHAPGARVSGPHRRAPICATRTLSPMPAPSAASALRVERTRRTFPAAFNEAQASGKPAIIRLAIDPEAITPTTTLAKIRAKSLAEKSSG